MDIISAIVGVLESTKYKYKFSKFLGKEKGQLKLNITKCAVHLPIGKAEYKTSLKIKMYKLNNQYLKSPVIIKRNPFVASMYNFKIEKIT